MVATKKPVSKAKKASSGAKSVASKTSETKTPTVESKDVTPVVETKSSVDDVNHVEDQKKEETQKRSKPDQEIRDRLLAAIPQELHDEAANTGVGYEFRMIRKKTKGDRIRPTLKISNFFVDIGSTLFYRRDVGIELTVVDEYHVTFVSTKGVLEKMSFASAQKDCDKQSRGFGIGGMSNPAWQNMFMIEKEDGSLETLTARRERIRDEKLAAME